MSQMPIGLTVASGLYCPSSQLAKRELIHDEIELLLQSRATSEA